MKAFSLSILLLTFCTLAYAGQEGSGGNFCQITVPCTEGESCEQKPTYRLLDELNFPEYLDPTLPELFNSLPVYTQGFHHFNLTETMAGEIARTKLKNISRINQLLAKRLENTFNRFQLVTSTPEFFSHSFAGDYSAIFPCTPQAASAAFVSWRDGKMMLSLSAWNVLNLQSQVILLIHETLRQASFTGLLTIPLAESDLQLLTMLINGEDLERLHHFIYFW